MIFEVTRELKMKIIKNTLELEIDEWSDPGQYPNALASGPLPSYDYIAGVDGEVIIELDQEELAAYQECPEDFLSDLDIPMLDGVGSWKFVVDELQGNVMTLHAEDVEGDPNWGVDEPDDEPDWGDYDYDPWLDRE